MTLHPQSELRDVDISLQEKEKITDFLQGKVDYWCKNREDEWFAARDLVGGENNDWNGTPLQCLYDKHAKTKSPQDAVEQAGIDVGWLLKTLLDKDSRNFNTDVKERVRQYQWKK